MRRVLQKLDKSGNMMIVVVLFVLMFASGAVTLELTLLQRVEARRYVQRNNAIYTADAMMDMYIYASSQVITSPTKPYTSGPLLTQAKINEFAEEMGDSVCEAAGSGKRVNLRDIYEIVSLMAFDKLEMTATLLDVMYDQVQIDNAMINSDMYQIDWDSPDTVFNGDAEDNFVLRPIKVRYKEYYKSYAVEKVVVFNKLSLHPVGSGPTFNLVVDDSDLVVTVDEYNCYE